MVTLMQAELCCKTIHPVRLIAKDTELDTAEIEIVPSALESLRPTVDCTYAPTSSAWLARVQRRSIASMGSDLCRSRAAAGWSLPVPASLGIEVFMKRKSL